MFEDAIQTLAQRQFQGRPLDGPLQVQMKFVMKKPKRPKDEDLPMVKPDIDNLFKSVADALNGILWHDDAQICSIYCEKIYETDELLEGIYLECKNLRSYEVS